MAKFISKYDSLIMVDSKGGLFSFEGGYLETTDKDKIATVKKSQLFDSYITEASAVAAKVEPASSGE